MAKGKKTGGRVKGVPNKTTTELKEFFDSVDVCLPEMVLQLLPNISDGKKVDALLRMMEFIYPKRKAVEVKNEEFGKLSYTDAIKALEGIEDEE